MAKENNKNDSTQLLVDLFERIKRISDYGYNEFSKKRTKHFVKYMEFVNLF